MSAPLGKWLTIHALRNADRTALVDGDTGEQFTYGELDERTTRLASAMKQRGVQPGDRVAIYSLNSPAMLELLFATAKLGAITVMVNFRLTAPEINFILKDSGADLMFASTSLRETAEAALDGTEVREILDLPTAAERIERTRTSFDELLEAGDPTAQFIDVDPETPAVLMYTSGTTGTPKGAMISHTNLFWVSLYHNSFERGLNRYDVNLVTAPLFHIGALAVYTLPSVYWGGANVVLENFNPATWAAAVEEYGVTKAFAVPTMWGALLQSGALDAHDVSSLDVAISGGAPCPIPIIDALQAKGISFTEGFGMTETAAMASTLPGEFVKTHAGSIGRPSTHVNFRAVDEHGRDVGVGEVGELIIQGPSIIKGYWNRPLANEESFKDGWFYSGDLVTFDEDGFYRIVDRKKDMVISGGENVYSVEVEQALIAHPAVGEVAIIGTPHPTWGEAVTAVIVKTEAATADEASLTEEIASYARERLAGYKVPKRIVFLETLPRTVAGKVRKVELREQLSAEVAD
ncbi:MAG: long-chain fatty acid--CoA ligase [Leucobacter sp.]|nr:long-chain fatty acid--CoA ligase [Leucobacter sp.]